MIYLPDRPTRTVPFLPSSPAISRHSMWPTPSWGMGNPPRAFVRIKSIFYIIILIYTLESDETGALCPSHHSLLHSALRAARPKGLALTPSAAPRLRLTAPLRSRSVTCSNLSKILMSYINCHTAVMCARGWITREGRGCSGGGAERASFTHRDSRRSR